MDRTARVAASSRTLAKLRTRTRTSVTARGVVHAIAAVIAPLSFVFALSFSLAARAEQSDVQRLEEKISATAHYAGIDDFLYIFWPQSTEIDTNNKKYCCYQV